MSPPIDHEKRKAALQAFATGALALPGLAGSAHADAPVDDTTLAYAFSYYREDDLSESNLYPTGNGSRDRYEIFANQFNLMTPITARNDLSVDLVYETMSGASPWWVEPSTSSSDPYLQVMSGASIEEDRVDGQLTLNHYFDKGKLGVTGGVSVENDYLSGNFGLLTERAYNDKNTTVTFGMGWSWDTVKPTNYAAFNRQKEYDKKSYSLDAGVAQVLSKSAILRVGVAYKKLSGFLSDPYKKVLVDLNSGPGVTVPDARPDERHQVAVSARYRQFIEAANAALHLDVSYSHDSWKLDAFTGEIAWHQAFLEHFEFVPKFRYYSQSDVSFYGPVFSGTPSHATSDYRLSPYGAMSYGAEFVVRIPSWPHERFDLVLMLGYERYMTSGDYALRSVEFANPGLVAYHLGSFQLGGRF